MPSINHLLVLASLALAACAGKPDATECATGITCPEGTKCAAAQPVCITNNCGDGVVETTEICDDGNIMDGDGCAANCLSREVCGDRVLNVAAGELCDDGNTDGGDGCSSDCRSVEVCGNGTRDVTEVCDDGNTVPGDGCSGNCKSTEVCGNGIVDINEKCDDANVPGGCNDDCQGGQGCGDGAIDKDANNIPIEECDDGNGDATDDCNLCHLTFCGDGIRQVSGSHLEQCDGNNNGTGGETPACNIDCTPIDCGDGKINNAAGEQCDDKNTVDTDACKNDCRLNVCGDGVEGGPNEACDTAGSSPTCNADCTLPSCGDGFVNTADGEECDPGGGSMPMSTATCDANCTVPVCGDGTTNMAAGEQCDDMNSIDTDDCLSDCTAATCGDGTVDIATGPKHEVCDDGNQTTEAACPYGTQSCTVCRDDCGALLSRTGNTCGDGNTASGFEMCDDGNRITEANCAYGTPTCMVCAGDCQSQVARTGLFCGDGLPAAGEACDDHNSMTCGSCDAGCNMITSAAATGYIVSVSGQEYSDGETITIKDGTSTVVFELDNDNLFTGTRVQFSNGDSATSVAGRLKTQINNSVLMIDAVNNGALVLLTHQRNTSMGNQAITSTVNDNDFSFDGMSGGAGGDCFANVGCMTGADCASNVCTNHQCVGP